MGYDKGRQLTNRSFFQNAGAICGAPSAAGAGSSSSWGSPNSPALRAELPAAQHRPAHGPSGVLSDNLADAAVLHVLMSLAYAMTSKLCAASHSITGGSRQIQSLAGRCTANLCALLVLFD